MTAVAMDTPKPAILGETLRRFDDLLAEARHLRERIANALPREKEPFYPERRSHLEPHEPERRSNLHLGWHFPEPPAPPDGLPQGIGMAPLTRDGVPKNPILATSAQLRRDASELRVQSRELLDDARANRNEAKRAIRHSEQIRRRVAAVVRRYFICQRAD